MLISQAWQDLSPKQQQLYTYCKLQYYGQSGRRAADKDDNSKFYFNKALWHGVYNLYPKTADGRFTKDMSALIAHGFIRCIETGQITRTKSIYQFSSMWQKWETTDFQLLPSELNMPLLKKFREENKKL